MHQELCQVKDGLVSSRNGAMTCTKGLRGQDSAKADVREAKIADEKGGRKDQRKNQSLATQRI